MIPANAFRTAVRYFGTNPFTREQLKEKYCEYVDSGSDKHFSSYFCKFQQRPYPLLGGVQIQELNDRPGYYHAI